MFSSTIQLSTHGRMKWSDKKILAKKWWWLSSNNFRSGPAVRWRTTPKREREREREKQRKSLWWRRRVFPQRMLFLVEQDRWPTLWRRCRRERERERAPSCLPPRIRAGHPPSLQITRKWCDIKIMGQCNDHLSSCFFFRLFLADRVTLTDFDGRKSTPPPSYVDPSPRPLSEPGFSCRFLNYY